MHLRASGASALSFTPIQATTTSIDAAESGAYVFTVPSGNEVYALPEGEYFMQAYERAGGADAMQEVD